MASGVARGCAARRTDVTVALDGPDFGRDAGLFSISSVAISRERKGDVYRADHLRAENTRSHIAAGALADYSSGLRDGVLSRTE